MQLGWERHFRHIVIPAWRQYLSAERQLTEAAKLSDQEAVEIARYDALREGGAASMYLHHFIEIVVNERPNFLPDDIREIKDAPSRLGSTRKWLAEACFMLRGDTLCADVELLRQVADALKHAALTRENLQIEGNDAVLITASSYGKGAYGAGKYGGGPTVWVLAKSGERQLTSILRNVIDAWHRCLDWNLP